MKKLTFLFALLCASVVMFAETKTDKVTMKGFGGITATGYQNITVAGESENSIAMVAYAFNGSSGQIRGNQTAAAGASVTSEDKNKNWSLYNSAAIPGAITGIKVTTTATGNNKFQNNLYVALGTESQGAVTSVTDLARGTLNGTTEFSFTIDATKKYTYFKLLSNEKFGSGTVAGVEVKITYETIEEGGDDTPAASHCHEALVNGENTIYLSTLLVSENNYQIKIESDAEMAGIGGSFAYKNGEAGYDIRTDMTISDDKKTITCNIESTEAPSLYTPLYVLMPGEVSFTWPEEVTWGACAEVIAVENITLNKTELALEEGASETLKATVTPEDATDKTVTWTSDNEEVATVDANGKVTAVAVGTATITATAGEKTATCAVTVAEAKKVTLDEFLTTKSKTDEVLFNDLTVIYANGQNTYVTDATGRALVAYDRNNTYLKGTATEGQLLKGLKGKYDAFNNQDELIPTAEPTIVDGTPAEPATLTQKPEEADLSKYVRFENVEITKSGNNYYIFDDVQLFDKFKLFTLEEGKYNVQGVTMMFNTTYELLLTKAPEKVVVPATGITLDETELALNVGESKTLTATVTPEDATDKTVTWTSSNEEVATVANGVVTGVADGTATITAKIGELTAECTVTVKFEAVPVTGITLSETEMELVVGEEDLITITVAPENANNQNVTVELSAEDIIEADLIDKTIAVKALKAGEVTITVTTEDGDFTASCKVTVKNPKQYALAEFIEAAPTAEVLLKDLTVIYASGKNTYVIDEEGTALVIYDANKTYYDGTLTAGKVLSGQKATYTAFNNQDEIVPTNTATISDGVAPVPTLLNEQPTTAQVNKYIRLENIEATLNGSFYYAYDGDLQLYGASGSLKPTANGKYNVEGIIVHFRGTQLEIIVTAIEPVKATALDALTDSTKAVKLIENGQVVILRDGKKFNVLGAEVK